MGEGPQVWWKVSLKLNLKKKEYFVAFSEYVNFTWLHVNIFKQPNSFTSLTSFSIQSIQFAFEFMKQLKNFILSLMSAI